MWSSGQPTVQRPGSSWGFGALLKGLTSVVDTSYQSRDLNPQPWVTSGFKSNALSIRPRLPTDRLDQIDIHTLQLIASVVLICKSLWIKVSAKILNILYNKYNNNQCLHLWHISLFIKCVHCCYTACCFKCLSSLKSGGF